MHRVVVLAFEGVQSLDITGPVEAFSVATRYFGGEYAIELVTPDGGPARASSGLSLNADRAAADVRGPIGTLVVAGGEGALRTAKDEPTRGWVRDAAARSERVASVCTGAFILAAAGLLDGRRATTHWDSCQRLAERHPQITVESDPIFVRDGNVLTSAGVTAGIDLALALIEDDLGPQAALRTAQALVMFVRRPGGQSQFSAQLKAAPARREPLRDVQAHIAEHPAADLSVPALAARAFMSERNFARAFRAETGMTPAVYVELSRVERARRELETTDLTVEAVAASCGFGTVETMRRAFARRVGVNPAAYRERFAA
jgi:transcriptional regulator GlxA family with amidase domain